MPGWDRTKLSPPFNSSAESDAHRCEVKFVVPVQELPTVMAQVRSHPAGFRQAFPPRRVNSIYFDTYGWTNVDDHLAGVAERCKLRLRWYGEDLQTVRGGVLELKQRRGTVGKKTTWPIRETIGLSGRTWNEIRRIVRERNLGPLEYAARHYSFPTMIISYDRQYFLSCDGQVRLTIDESLAIYAQIFAPHPQFNRRLLTPDDVIIELKATDSTWRRVSEIMAPLPFRSLARSKYILGAGVIA